MYDDAARKYIAEFFALVRNVGLGVFAGHKFDDDRLHSVFLRVVYKPVDFQRARIFFDEIVFLEDDFFFLFFGEEFFEICAERRQDVYKRRNRRTRKVVFELTYIALRQFAPVGKFFLRQRTMKSQFL